VDRKWRWGGGRRWKREGIESSWEIEKETGVGRREKEKGKERKGMIREKREGRR
jgi:hypothetical protein